MPIITQIVSQVKNLDRASLFVDGDFRCGISKLVVGTFRLKVGQEISEQDIERYIFESDKDKAFAYALNYVTRYSPTERQLTRKLYDKKFCKSIVDFVVAKCKEYGYINDLEYARCYVNYNKDLKGKIKIKSDLMQKGIQQDIIAEVLEDMPTSDGAFVLAQKHSKNEDIFDRKYQAKLARYLAGKGYEWTKISDCLQRLKEQQENCDD
ncbi:MAG: regulatory protein RecX [Clostridia bacterium]